MDQSKKYHLDVYQPRNPKTSEYYKCVENHFEELERAWDDMYATRYGFWRTYVMTVIYRYLDCGDLHMGFARVRCEECGHEYLLAFSCKRRQFCPSCHQKRMIEYGECLLTEVLKDVPHRQWVFDDKAGGVQAFGLFVLMGGAFHVILSVVSAMTAAHPARAGRTRLDAGYLPE
jgi:ribosomal protein S27E